LLTTMSTVPVTGTTAGVGTDNPDKAGFDPPGAFRMLFSSGALLPGWTNAAATAAGVVLELAGTAMVYAHFTPPLAVGSG